MKIRLVNPVMHGPQTIVQPARRPASLDRIVLGLIDNGKTHATELLTGVAAQIAKRHAINTAMVRKQIVSLPPSDADIETLAKQCGAILTAVGD
jgi:hypothetical protein